MSSPRTSNLSYSLVRSLRWRQWERRRRWWWPQWWCDAAGMWRAAAAAAAAWCHAAQATRPAGGRAHATPGARAPGHAHAHGRAHALSLARTRARAHAPRRPRRPWPPWRAPSTARAWLRCARSCWTTPSAASCPAPASRPCHAHPAAAGTPRCCCPAWRAGWTTCTPGSSCARWWMRRWGARSALDGFSWSILSQNYANTT